MRKSARCSRTGVRFDSSKLWILDRKWRGRSRVALTRTWRLSRRPRAFSAMGRGGTSAQGAVPGEQSPNCAREMSSHSTCSTAPGDRGSRPGGHRGPTCGRAQGSKRGKSTRGRLREFALRVVSHNAQSLRQPGAIEVATNHMHRHKVHTCAVQEAWWGGTGVLCNQDHTTLGANEGGTTRRAGAHQAVARLAMLRLQHVDARPGRAHVGCASRAQLALPCAQLRCGRRRCRRRRSQAHPRQALATPWGSRTQRAWPPQRWAAMARWGPPTEPEMSRHWAPSAYRTATQSGWPQWPCSRALQGSTGEPFCKCTRPICKCFFHSFANIDVTFANMLCTKIYPAHSPA